MPRASRTKVVVEIDSGGSRWMLFKGGFGRIPDAEKWIMENISEGMKLRVAKVSGLFQCSKQVTKR